MTRLEGKKFKVAHKRAVKNKWSITEKTQRKRVIQYLEQVIAELKEADENEMIPYTIGEVERIYGLEHRTKKELYQMAVEMDLPDRSKMSRGDLLAAIKEDKYGEFFAEPEESQKYPAPKLKENTKDDLYKMAIERSIRGRSEMKKADLVKVFKQEMAKEPQL